MNGHFTFFGARSVWDSPVVKFPHLDNPYLKVFSDPQFTIAESILHPQFNLGDPIESGALTAQPFVLAMPHHTTAWQQTFADPNDPSIKKQQHETTIKQLDLAKEQMQQQIQQIENYKNKLQEEFQKSDGSKNQ